MRRSALLVGLIVLAAAAATAVWWWREDRPAVLDPDWTPLVSVLAGDGVAEWRDGPATHARFSDPFDVASVAGGRLHVSDGGAHRIRTIAADGSVSTLAGSVRGFADGAPADARFDTPSGIAAGPDGSLYVADTANNAVRRIAPSGLVTTIAGDGVAGYRDGPGPQARFNAPLDVAVAPDGRIIVADTYNDRIRAIAPDGTVSTLTGGTPGFADGPAAGALLDTPVSVAADADGAVFIADTGNDALRRLDAAGALATVDVVLADAVFRPTGLAVAANGTLYLTDERGRVIERRRDGAARVLAGSLPGFRDGGGDEALFRRPSGLAVAGDGRLVVADAGNGLVRLVAARTPGALGPPASPFIAPRFDADAFARLPLLWPVMPMDGPYEVAGTMGEARGGEGSERFHAGVDVRVEEGTPVVAVRDGAVAAPISAGELGTLNEWLRVGPVTYVHVRAGRARDDVVHDGRFAASYDERGKIARLRLKRGARFSTGETIASVNRFNHVHLNVGWPGEEHNPLRFRLAQFRDSVPPTIARGGVRLFDEHARPFSKRQRGRLLVWGRVQIVVDAWDQADGNRPGRRLGLYAAGYQVLNRDGSPAPGHDTVAMTLLFDRLSPSPDAPRLVFAPGSGIPHYGVRRTRFLYVVTNTFRHGAAAPGYWDAAALPPGDYLVRVHAADVHGNTAAAHRDVPVTVISSATN